tara:strand:- start:396 stop:1250 length:855 start_codon:yes stop_codon:yes gene_type:complete
MSKQPKKHHHKFQKLRGGGGEGGVWRAQEIRDKGGEENAAFVYFFEGKALFISHKMNIVLYNTRKNGLNIDAYKIKLVGEEKVMGPYLGSSSSWTERHLDFLNKYDKEYIENHIKEKKEKKEGDKEYIENHIKEKKEKKEGDKCNFIGKRIENIEAEVWGDTYGGWAWYNGLGFPKEDRSETRRSLIYIIKGGDKYKHLLSRYKDMEGDTQNAPPPRGREVDEKLLCERSIFDIKSNDLNEYERERLRYAKEDDGKIPDYSEHFSTTTSKIDLLRFIVLVVNKS